MSGPRLKGVLQTLGPGILFAGAAIGVSHLVQSTRAGADYGFGLLWAVVLALLFKYPFFEYSQRYTAAMGESLLEGYLRVGRGALGLFLAFVVGLAFITTAAVTLVTGALLGNLLGLQWAMWKLAGLVLAIVGAILLWGRYRALDRLMKLMIVALAALTLTAVGIAFGHGPAGDESLPGPELWTGAGIAFLLALMGWMPAPIDVAVWPSLWALERRRETQHRPTLGEALVDFNVGYLTTGVLAVAFVSFGALVMHGTGERFSNSGLVFAGQLIDMYSQTLGAWSRWLISLVAFITMFSTTLTVCDGYARTLQGSIRLLAPRLIRGTWRSYWGFLALLMGLAIAIIGLFMSGLKTLIDFATILAFLTAPPLAVLNHLAATGRWMPREFLPGRTMRILSWLGMLFLVGFGVLYIVIRWF